MDFQCNMAVYMDVNQLQGTRGPYQPGFNGMFPSHNVRLPVHQPGYEVRAGYIGDVYGHYKCEPQHLPDFAISDHLAGRHFDPPNVAQHYRFCDAPYNASRVSRDFGIKYSSGIVSLNNVLPAMEGIHSHVYTNCNRNGFSHDIFNPNNLEIKQEVPSEDEFGNCWHFLVFLLSFFLILLEQQKYFVRHFLRALFVVI